MHTIKNLDELLANLGPYLKSAQPLEAMKKAGFTFSGEIKKAIDSQRATKPIDPATVERLDKELASSLPIRLQVGTPAKPPISRVVVGGFRAAMSIDLDTVNPVIAKLFEVGTLPNAIPASDLAELGLDLPTLSQLCTNVPITPDASIGPLQILTAPTMTASLVSQENVVIMTEIVLPVLGSQPSALKAALHVEIPIGALDIGATGKGLRLGVLSTGAQATLITDPSSQIQPRSATALNELNNLATTAVQKVLGLYFILGTITLPAEFTTEAFPNTHIKLMNAGAVTDSKFVVSRGQKGQKSFAILGVNIDSGQRTLNPLDLTTVVTPVAPFAFHGEIDEAFATDAVTAVINSGDLAAYINGITSRHWWGDILPPVNVTEGTVNFQDGNVTLTIHIVVPHYCFGFDLDLEAVIEGPPVISNGIMTIGATSVGINVVEGLWCYLSGGNFFGALLGLVLQIIFAGREAFSSLNVKTIPSSYSFAPLPGTDEDWTLAVQQASANNGTLTVDGTATLAADPGYFIYLRIVTGNAVTGYTPLPNAQVTLMELDNPAPAGDDVVIPQTGTTIRTNAKFVITDVRSYTPNADQTLGIQTTDDNGDVFFIVEAETPTNPDGMNQIGGMLTETVTTSSLQSGKESSSTTTTLVPEGRPDFGVAVTDSSGYVLATRQLVVLNAATTRIGTAQNPVIVVVSEPVIGEQTSDIASTNL